MSVKGTIISIDGVTLASLGATGTISSDTSAQTADVQTTDRLNGTPVYAGSVIESSSLDAVFTGITSDANFMALQALLDARLNHKERVIVAYVGSSASPTIAQTTFRVADVRVDGGGGISATLIDTEGIWRAQVATYASQSGSVSPVTLSHTNQGQAPVRPVYQLSWSVQRVTKTSTIGWQYRKRMTLTNGLGRTVPEFPWRISLGNTATLVSGGKALASGDDLRILVNGEDLERSLVGWNLSTTYCWVVLPGMDVGETLTVDVIYGNASAGAPPTWADNDFDRPVFDHKWETGTATGGSTTTLVRTGAGWETDQWKFGTLRALSGASANENHLVGGNTSDTLTIVSTGNAIAAGNTYLLTMSANDKWVYAVRQTDRKTDYRRGRWGLSSSRVMPSNISFDAPGSWHPELICDNRDSMGQFRVSTIFVAAGDSDPFAILDARRTWEGNDRRVPNAGTADGVAITFPWPATTMNWSYVFNNPNAMCLAGVYVRTSGAEEWAEAWTDAVAASFAVRTVADLDLTPYGSTYHVAQALLPVDSVEIGLDWKSIEGSATSGTTTTVGDSTLTLATNQFAGGKLRIFSGDNAGRARAISSNTGTIFTTSAFPNANADGDRYRASNPLLTGWLRDSAYLSISLDPSGITDSGLGTETAVYDMAQNLWIGAGPPGADPTGQHRAKIGRSAGARRLLLAANERIEIDAERRVIRIVQINLAATTATGGDSDSINKTAAGWTTDAYTEQYVRLLSGSAAGVYKIRSNSTARLDIYGTLPASPASGDTFEIFTYTGYLTDPMVIVQYHNGEEWLRSADWLRFGTGAQTVMAEETNLGTIAVSMLYLPSYLG